MQVNSMYQTQATFKPSKPSEARGRGTTSTSSTVATADVALKLQSKRGDDILRLIQQIFGHQTHTFSISNGGTLEVEAFDFMMDNITPEQASELIGEDGFFGVERTSERLFNLAASFAGGDPEVMKEMKQAVIDGFNAASAAWGGDLPQISHDTLARTMERFNEWFELNV